MTTNPGRPSATSSMRPVQDRLFVQTASAARWALIVGALAIALPMFAQTPAPAQTTTPASNAPAASEVVSLPEFTVSGSTTNEWAASESLTGSRSATSIRELPNDVVVVTNEFIKDFGLFDFDRAFSYSSSFAAEEVEGQYNVRGFTGGSQLMNGFRRGGLVESNNIERAEILKGPMAAIYGQTSPGGAVNIIPKRPSSRQTYSLDAMVGGGELAMNRVAGEMSGPVGKKWALGQTFYRVASSKYHRDYTQKYRDMTQTNFNYSLTHKFAPTTSLWLEMDYTRKAMHRGNQVPFLFATTPRPVGTGTYSKILDYAYDLLHFSLDGPDEYNNRVMRQMSGEFQHRFNQTFSLRVAGSKFNREFHRQRAALSSTLNIAGPRTLSRSSPSYSYINEYGGGAQVDVLARYKTGELRQQSLLTLDYRRDGGKNHIRNLSAAQQADPAVRGKTSVAIDTATAADYDIYEFTTPPANYLAPGNPSRNISNVLGIYGRHTLWAWEDRIVATAGYRYDNSDVKTVTYSDPVVFATPTNSRVTKSHAARPHFGAVYKVTKEVSLYASYSESFNLNTATNNAGARLPAESGKSKEVGIKTGLFEERLNLTLSFYDLKRTNVVVTELVDPVLNITDNVVDGAQRSKGVDLDGSWAVNRSLQLLWGASILDSKVTDAGVDLDRVGRPTSRTPKRQFNMAARYGIQEGRFKGLSFLGGVNYRDKAYPDLGGQQDFNNDRLNSPGENDNRRNVFVPSVTIWNFGAFYTYRPKESRFSHTVRLNLNNAFNKAYIDTAGRAADLRVATVTYGVKF